MYPKTYKSSIPDENNTYKTIPLTESTSDAYAE